VQTSPARWTSWFFSRVHSIIKQHSLLHRLTHLVDVESLHLILAFPHLLVAAHKHDLRNPRQRKCRNRKGRRTAQRNDVARLVRRGPEVRGPDETRVHDRGHDTDCNSLLLGRLATGRTAPSEDERVDAVGADSEDDHGGVAARYADGGRGDEETDNGHALGDGDVPCALVELARGPGDCDCDDTSDQVGWACQDESHEFAEAESLNNGREEILEAIGCEVLLERVSMVL
jgi:hypothetical protein